MSSRNVSKWIDIWNRKFHIYIGLYLLLFVWLFSITGIILNHPKWKFAEFWSKRKETSYEQPIQLPTESNDLVKARSIMQQLDISGEIEWTETRPGENHVDFRVVKPGRIIDIKTDLDSRLTTVAQIQTNEWGVLNFLHQFTGVGMNQPERTCDWLMPERLSFSMDVVLVGLFVMVLGGLYMWYQLKRRKRLGLDILLLVILSCGFFVVGLR